MLFQKKSKTKWIKNCMFFKIKREKNFLIKKKEEENSLQGHNYFYN